ncbi:MAG TPA: rod shape-determining protein MreC, partial [Candidatus Paceibacterota bacterium]|nr:rod shape-determining protein MreC [Candidatus Paceibacterota bacterium]
MFTAAVVVMLLIMSAAAVSGVRTSWVTALGARVVVPTMSVARSVRSFVATFMSRRDLVREDAQLQAQLQDSEHQTAQIALLSQELETARAAAELHQRITGSYTEAGIVAWPREGGVREVIIDRGSRDGIEVGDDVVTPHGALIGTVRSTGSDSATVT